MATGICFAIADSAVEVPLTSEFDKREKGCATGSVIFPMYRIGQIGTD